MALKGYSAFLKAPASPSDSLVSYPEYLLGSGVLLLSWCILHHQLTGPFGFYASLTMWEIILPGEKTISILFKEQRQKRLRWIMGTSYDHEVSNEYAHFSRETIIYSFLTPSYGFRKLNNIKFNSVKNGSASTVSISYYNLTVHEHSDKRKLFFCLYLWGNAIHLTISLQWNLKQNFW